MSGNRTKCPDCGNMVGMLEGKAEVTVENKINMLSGIPPITKRMLEEFDLLTREAKRHMVPLPVYAVQASKIHPSFGMLVSNAARTIGSSKVKKVTQGAVYGLVLAWITQCSLDINMNIDLDINELFNQNDQPSIEHFTDPAPADPPQGEAKEEPKKDEPVEV